jgi:hypothetical protein
MVHYLCITFLLVLVSDLITFFRILWSGDFDSSSVNQMKPAFYWYKYVCSLHWQFRTEISAQIISRILKCKKFVPSLASCRLPLTTHWSQFPLSLCTLTVNNNERAARYVLQVTVVWTFVHPSHPTTLEILGHVSFCFIQTFPSLSEPIIVISQLY